MIPWKCRKYTKLVIDTAWQTRQHCELLGVCRYEKLVDDAEALTYHVLPALQAERTTAAYQAALGPAPFCCFLLALPARACCR